MDRYLLISAKHQGILILYNKYATNIHKSNAAQTYAYTDQNGVPIFTLQMTPGILHAQTNTHIHLHKHIHIHQTGQPN